MTELDRLVFRSAGATDAEAIAVLHADSWRRHYREAYSDRFLDGDVRANRREVWSRRLRSSRDVRHTIVADSGAGIVGFAQTMLDEDERWGGLLENLHVASGHQRRGIGARLLVVVEPQGARCGTRGHGGTPRQRCRPA